MLFKKLNQQTLPAKSALFRVVVAPGAASLVVRKATPMVRTAVVVWHGPRPVGAKRRSVVQDVRGLSTDVPHSKIAGDPILLLDRNRNASPRQVLSGTNPYKRPDFADVMDKVGLLERDTPQRRAQIRQFADQAVQRARIAAGPKVRLGVKGNGLAYYTRQRVKPALPRGFQEWVGLTRPDDTRGVTSLQTRMPITVGASLAAEGQRAEVLGPSNAQPVSVPDSVSVYNPNLREATSASEGAGRWVVLAAAMVFAFWILRGKA